MPRQLLKNQDLHPEAFSRLQANLRRCRERINEAALQAGRDAEEISLVAVTKYVDAEVNRLLYHAGVRDFGESTVQGADAKRQQLKDLTDTRWHFIGHLQRNKVARALQFVSTIHSVDSVRLVREISRQRKKSGQEAPGLYVEVNLGSETHKSGLPPADLRDLLEVLRDEDVVSSWEKEVLGLMTMAPYSDNPEDARPFFRNLNELRDNFTREGLLPKTAGLSIGMSGDFPTAIEEGATVVRIGSLLFDGLTKS
jgi:pyridoxal phosphate enzyme (YggS family)